MSTLAWTRARSVKGSGGFDLDAKTYIITLRLNTSIMAMWFWALVIRKQINRKSSCGKGIACFSVYYNMVAHNPGTRVAQRAGSLQESWL
jgi:hypothetical protein